MSEKKRIKTVEIDFSELTPQMQIEKVKHSPLYEKAMTENGKQCGSDYSRNTATWD